MLRDLVAKGDVMRDRMRRPGEAAAEERSATDGMLLRMRPCAHAQQWHAGRRSQRSTELLCSSQPGRSESATPSRCYRGWTGWEEGVVLCLPRCMVSMAQRASAADARQGGAEGWGGQCGGRARWERRGTGCDGRV